MPGDINAPGGFAYYPLYRGSTAVAAKNAPADFFLDRGVFLCYNTNATLKKAAILARSVRSGPKVQKEVLKNGIKEV